MPESIAFKIARGLAYRTVWILLLIFQAVLAFVAFIGFFGVVIQVVDKGGGASVHVRAKVTVAQRCLMGIIQGSIGCVALAGAFEPRPGVPVPERAVLVDDVVTTGGTIAACADALYGGGATDVAAVAYALTPGR